VSDQAFERELRRLLDSGDYKTIARVLARMLREEERKREALDKLRQMGGNR
jgi:hypothetical protein